MTMIPTTKADVVEAAGWFGFEKCFDCGDYYHNSEGREVEGHFTCDDCYIKWIGATPAPKAGVDVGLPPAGKPFVAILDGRMVTMVRTRNGNLICAEDAASMSKDYGELFH
jgi:hypothetical protein